MAEEPEFIIRENIAQALGGISPFDEKVSSFNTYQAQMLMIMRYGEEIEEQKVEESMTADAKRLELRDQALYGFEPFQPSENEEDEYDGFDDDVGSFDYSQLSEI